MSSTNLIAIGIQILSSLLFIVATMLAQKYLIPNYIEKQMKHLFNNIIKECISGQLDQKMKGAAFILLLVFSYLMMLVIISDIVLNSIATSIEFISTQSFSVVLPIILLVIFIILSGVLITRVESEINDRELSTKAKETSEEILEKVGE